MIIIDYQPDHLVELMSGDLNEGAPENIGYMVDYADNYLEDGSSYTLVHNGYIICCAGILTLWNGVGEAWFVASHRIHEDARPFIRFARNDVMLPVVQQNGLWRVQATVKVGWERALRFAEFMGFESEGVMRQYGPEKGDYFRVARLFNG